MKASIAALTATMIFSVTGCVVVPLPHISHRSPPIDGRVVDGVTGRPVQCALVELTLREGGAHNYGWRGDVRPGPTARTTADGYFHFDTKYNFHLLWYANLSFQFHLPSGTYWTGELRVTHDGYRPLVFSSADDWHGGTCVRVGALALAPDGQETDRPNRGP